MSLTPTATARIKPHDPRAALYRIFCLLDSEKVPISFREARERFRLSAQIFAVGPIPFKIASGLMSSVCGFRKRDVGNGLRKPRADASVLVNV